MRFFFSFAFALLASSSVMAQSFQSSFEKLKLINKNSEVQAWQQYIPLDVIWRKRFLYSCTAPMILELPSVQLEAFLRLQTYIDLEAWRRREKLPELFQITDDWKTHEGFQKFQEILLEMRLNSLKDQLEIWRDAIFDPKLGFSHGQKIEASYGFYISDLLSDTISTLSEELPEYQSSLHQKGRDLLVDILNEIFRPEGTYTFPSLLGKASKIYIFLFTEAFLNLAFKASVFLEAEILRNGNVDNSEHKILLARLILFASRALDVSSQERVGEILDIEQEFLDKSSPSFTEEDFPSLRDAMDNSPVPKGYEKHPAVEVKRLELGMSRYAVQSWNNLTPIQRAKFSQLYMQSTIPGVSAPNGQSQFESSPLFEMFKHFQAEVKRAATFSTQYFFTLYDQIYVSFSQKNLQEYEGVRIIDDIESSLAKLGIQLPEKFEIYRGSLNESQGTLYRELDQLASRGNMDLTSISLSALPLRSVQEISRVLPLKSNYRYALQETKNFLSIRQSLSPFQISDSVITLEQYQRSISDQKIPKFDQIIVHPTSHPVVGAQWERESGRLDFFLPSDLHELIYIAKMPWSAGFDTQKDFDVATSLLLNQVNFGPGAWVVFPTPKGSVFRRLALDQQFDLSWLKSVNEIRLCADLLSCFYENQNHLGLVESSKVLENYENDPSNITIRNLLVKKLVDPPIRMERFVQGAGSLIKRYSNCATFFSSQGVGQLLSLE